MNTAANGKGVLEIERRFLPKYLPKDYKRFPSSIIMQGYLEDGPRTRVRSEAFAQAQKFLRTRKVGSGVIRTEFEKELTAKAFKKLWKKVKHSVSKIRYFIPYGEYTVELNFFVGAAAGYVQIEVEFASKAALKRFKPPVWFGRDVTNENAHGNYRIACDGPPK